MCIQQIRNETLKITYGGMTFLLDPCSRTGARVRAFGRCATIGRMSVRPWTTCLLRLRKSWAVQITFWILIFIPITLQKSILSVRARARVE